MGHRHILAKGKRRRCKIDCDQSVFVCAVFFEQDQLQKWPCAGMMLVVYVCIRVSVGELCGCVCV